MCDTVLILHAIATCCLRGPYCVERLIKIKEGMNMQIGIEMQLKVCYI